MNGRRAKQLRRERARREAMQFWQEYYWDELIGLTVENPDEDGNGGGGSQVVRREGDRFQLADGRWVEMEIDKGTPEFRMRQEELKGEVEKMLESGLIPRRVMFGRRAKRQVVAVEVDTTTANELRI